MTRFLLKGPGLGFQARLASSVGLNEAIILQQIHYWLGVSASKHIKDGRAWIYNSYTQWKEQFTFWSEITVRRTIRSLEKQGFLISRISEKSYNKVKWYSINYERLLDLGFNLNECENESEILSHDEHITYHLDQIDHHEQPDQNDQVDCQSGSSKRSDEEIKMISCNKVTENTTKKENSLSNTVVDKKRDAEQKAKIQIERELLNIWNEEFQQEGREEVELTIERAKALKSIFMHYFDNEIEKWQRFCSLIRSSKFLMGEVTNFQASFDWCIKPHNVQKIKEGNYKFNDRTSIRPLSSFQASTQNWGIKKDEKINLFKALDPTWSNVLDKLRAGMGADTVKAWLEGLSYQKTGEKSVKLTAATRFIKRTVEERYSDKVLGAFKNIGSDIDELIVDHVASGSLLTGASYGT